MLRETFFMEIRLFKMFLMVSFLSPDFYFYCMKAAAAYYGTKNYFIA